MLIPLHRRSWERAVVAIAPLTTQYRVGAPDELEYSARKLSKAVDLRAAAEGRESLDDDERLRSELAFRRTGD